MRNIIATVALSVVSLAAAADPHSFAEPGKFLVRHVDLDLAVDFNARRLEGTADLTVEQVDPAANELVLDSSGLEIRTVHLIEMSGRAKVLAFRLGNPDPILGSRLSIEFPHCCAATAQMRIRIDYRTSDQAGALQWLEPVQTSGPHPFMYTQGQAILTRFVRDICGCRGDWNMPDYVSEAVEKIRAQVGSEEVILGLSGGVDSSVAAALIHRAIGDQLTCVFVDHGLLRLNEADVKRRIRSESARDKVFEKGIHDFLQGFERLLEDATTSTTADEELEEYLSSPLGRVYLLVGATVGYFA